MANKLIEKARSFKTKKQAATVATKDHVELILAFFDGEITSSQLSYALDIKAGSGYGATAAYLRSAYLQGLVSITLKK